ncbi:toxin-antitoxin system, toxin component, Bro family [Kingella oralis ATCC 51147]|uniref:Toxin-antitoxin system, toxin component, Bro family n=2 Tax=Kingella TaxID=32257 RepID=C4GFS8_9NEIS|nr:toxin-antitoxin system, toxin component, Bro family [Kingella oralis ATCC 51147]
MTELLTYLINGDLIMTELFVLVNRPVAGQAQQTVNARELHAFLESKQEFSNWIKNRIEDYGFLDGVDFLTNLSKTQGRPRIDYFLSLDMAKELSMVERNAKGKQARQYFIDCEKRLSGSLKVDFNDPLQAAKAFIEAETARRDAERKLQIAGGALTRLGAAKGSQCLRESAKLLKWQQTPFIDWLLVKKMLFRDAGKQLCVYQEYLGRGWFEYRTDEKNGHAFKQVMVTPLGLQKLAQKLEVVA